MIHSPVLKKEVLECLAPKPGENFIDCTLGQGGHALAILEKVSPGGKVLGIDADKRQIENCSAAGGNCSKLKIENYKERLILVNDSYVNLKKIVEKYNFYPVNGILLDLGMSSWHLEESGRGFTFLKDEPLDMRYEAEIQDPLDEKSASGRAVSEIQNRLTAERIVNEWTELDIRKILEEYGEERFSKKIVKEIVRTRTIRPIKTTVQLAEIIKRAVPRRYLHQKIHFATRVFQALRIAVNDELNNLKKTLPQAKDILAPGGRMAVISFHSLEDRIVKNFLKEEKQFLTILTGKPVTPTEEEIKNNSRSRSAKMRAAQKLKI